MDEQFASQIHRGRSSSTCHGMILRVDPNLQFADTPDSDRQFGFGWFGLRLALVLFLVRFWFGVGSDFIACMLHG